MITSSLVARSRFGKVVGVAAVREEVDDIPPSPTVSVPAAVAAEDQVSTIAEAMQGLLRSLQRWQWQAASRLQPAESATNRLVAVLVRQGPMRLTALAESAQCELSTVSRQVSTMVRDGLVQRRPDPVDGRAGLLVPTELAQLKYADHLARRDSHVAGILLDWTEADITALARLLLRLASDVSDYQQSRTTMTKEEHH